MSSKIIFSGIKARNTKTEISATEKKYGRLHSSVVTKITKEHVLDVLLLSNEHTLIADETIEINEAYLVDRKTILREDLTNLDISKGRAAVGTDFFKKFKNGDVIEVVLHEL
jgi:hypothetical protein